MTQASIILPLFCIGYQMLSLVYVGVRIRYWDGIVGWNPGVSSPIETTGRWTVLFQKKIVCFVQTRIISLTELVKFPLRNDKKKL